MDRDPDIDRSIVRISEIVDAVQEYDPGADVDLIYKAYVYSARVHQGQQRSSGEPYLNHPLWVSYLLTQLHADVPTVAAGLLHDTIEDTWATHDDLEETFGPHVTALVDGVTKLSKIQYTSKEARQADSFRKMIVAMAQDLRVIMIKLADRLHNMRTLGALAPEKRRAIARETMDLYAPLAGRLGIQWIKTELEDQSFRYLEPERFAELQTAVADYQHQSEAYIAKVTGELAELVAGAGIAADVSGRPKHLYSIWRKMQKRGVGPEEIYDLIAFRVIVDDLRQCYEVLGLAHTRWTPVPGRFKDYVAMPKANAYQSLHTTVIGPEGRPIEIQIRTADMHRVAELGVAAHWAYKEAGGDHRDQEQFQWLRELYQWHTELKDSEQFVETVRLDLFQDEVYVFSPAGDVVELPAGSTPLDFAYKIHTEVGHHAGGAKVNGRIVPLETELKTGDIVEILTQQNQVPRRNWLKIVRTSSARQKIRSYLNRQEREQARTAGRGVLQTALREAKVGDADRWLGSPAGKQLLKDLGVQDKPSLIQALGYGKLSPRRLRQALGLEAPEGEPAPAPREGRATLLPAALERLWKRSDEAAGSALLVDGQRGVETQLARCCNPLPGDKIIGYIRVGKGIKVHKASCSHLVGANPERFIDVAWSGDHRRYEAQPVQILVETTDTPGILGKIGKAVSDEKINIRETTIRSIGGGKAEGVLSVEVRNRGELDRVIDKLRKVRGVSRVHRRD